MMLTPSKNWLVQARTAMVLCAALFIVLPGHAAASVQADLPISGGTMLLPDHWQAGLGDRSQFEILGQELSVLGALFQFEQRFLTKRQVPGVNPFAGGVCGSDAGRRLPALDKQAGTHFASPSHILRHTAAKVWLRLGGTSGRALSGEEREPLLLAVLAVRAAVWGDKELKKSKGAEAFTPYQQFAPRLSNWIMMAIGLAAISFVMRREAGREGALAR
jgi:hypothetical protein